MPARRATAELKLGTTTIVVPAFRPACAASNAIAATSGRLRVRCMGVPIMLLRIVADRGPIRQQLADCRLNPSIINQQSANNRSIYQSTNLPMVRQKPKRSPICPWRGKPVPPCKSGQSQEVGDDSAVSARIREVCAIGHVERLVKDVQRAPSAQSRPVAEAHVELHERRPHRAVPAAFVLDVAHHVLTGPRRRGCTCLPAAAGS